MNLSLTQRLKKIKTALYYVGVDLVSTLIVKGRTQGPPLQYMSIVLNPQEPAISRGIRTVGVGKKGSHALSDELIHEIFEDLKSGKVFAAAKGAFLAGLLAKGLELQEEILVGKDPQHLVQTIAGDAPEFVQWVCLQLFSGQTLDKKTAYDLGCFLFSDQPGDGARGFIASFLRVRYETDDEYEGLLQALQETLLPAFTKAVPSGEPLVQLAEPFDGVDHSTMITPLIGHYMQSLGYRAVHMVGKNSGPKMVMNLWDIAQELGQPAMQGSNDLAASKPPFGWFGLQNSMSSAFERWHSIRLQTIKRPFMSTIERFINPFKADILIASAFHPSYGEKMLTIAERAGFRGIAIVRNGIEGSVAFALKRPVKILVSSRQKDGSYKRDEKIFELEKFLGVTVPLEERVTPTAKENAYLIKRYYSQGSSGHQLFDWRVKVTCEGLKQAITSQ